MSSEPTGIAYRSFVSEDAPRTVAHQQRYVAQGFEISLREEMTLGRPQDLVTARVQ